MKGFTWRHLVIFIILIQVLQIAANQLRLGFDDTDDHDRGIRSGMVLRTDHGTGCQYLGRAFAELTPRLDGDGNHVGCR